MGKGQHDDSSRYVRMLFDVGTIGGLTDGQLLERFIAQGPEASELAFATLVERHGPMVFRVCRSVLRDPDEAHDAFQATFLVLVRRASSLWVRDSLGPWLHQVAYRVASCARADGARRRRHERRAAELSGPARHEEDHDDLGDVLHDEVNRLPSGCRAAVVLCYFDGMSPEQAAGQLGCPVGTVQSRLARGRARLRTRLMRRGLAPALGALATGVVADAAPVLPPASLVEATLEAALPIRSAAVGASGSVIRLTQGALRTMFLIKLRTVAATIITLAALAVGARSLLSKAPAPRPQPNLDQVRAELGASAPNAEPQREPSPETGPPPQDLAWIDVPLPERLQIVEQLAAQSRGNFARIATWQGSYSYLLRQYLDEQFVAQLRAGAANGVPKGTRQPLIQEFDSVLKFAIDAGSDSIYRDIETSRMRFLGVGTDEEVKIANVGAPDHRSIVTPTVYLFFHPKERATSSFLPNHPQAQRKRRAERFPVREAAMREGGTPDPREFFKFDPGNSFWTGLELYARAFRGELGADQKNVVEQHLKIGKAEGPGGRWYRDQMGFTNPGGPTLWITTFWSPQAGYNPVSMLRSHDTPDGKPESKIEWQWKQIEGIYIPSTIKESAYRAAGGALSKEQTTRLKECALNRPLSPHQFDERGLGLVDGDLVLNHLERVAYIFKGGQPVKLANFGEGSVLRQAPPKRSPAPAARPRSQATGRIYTRASLRTDDRGMPVSSVVAVDPESGEVTKVFDGYPGRLRVSPDGRSVAFVSGEWWTNSPVERMQQSLWIRALADDAMPQRAFRLDRTDSGGALPVWSAAGKQLIFSVGTYDDSLKKWVNETFRINADGSGKEPLKIPAEDTVQDWSSDGAWLVTASSRNARIGWQLYVMRPDGSEARQVTEGGNPFFARFSPDGKKLLHSDGTTKLVDRQGIWVVDLQTKNRRRILATGNGTASACWSPDGQRIAVAIGGSKPEEHGRLELVTLDGTHRTLLTLPSQEIADMPDWR
jgi:RNA polymerase sigma factor (sigma-70 family)